MAVAILEAVHISKQFGGLKAVDDVSLTVREGEIQALIGPNGAGKTTCFNLLTGFLHVTSGVIRFMGRDITGLAPASVARLGLVRSFQISSVFPGLTALDNVRLALQKSRGRSLDFWRSETVLGRYDGRAMELLEMMGLQDSAPVRAADLPYGRKRALEFATTLALDPKLLLLDEPTSGMGREDIGRVMDMVRRVRAGRTILMVEHNLSVVEGLCDTVTVLARGNVLAEGSYADVSKNPEVISAYLGIPDA
jgi:branched-chain amino acid transport system ATP-binding protein